MTFSEDAELEMHDLLMVGVEIPTDIAHDSNEIGELELEDTKVKVILHIQHILIYFLVI